MAKGGIAAVAVVALALLAGCSAKGGTHPSTSAPAGLSVPAPEPAATNASTPPQAIVQARLFETGHAAGEPSLSVDAAGHLFVTSLETSTTAGGGLRTGLLRSDDDGQTWRDVSPQIGGQSSQPSTVDPFFYEDPTTGRLFVLDQQGVNCNLLSTSSDFGATWNPPEPTCPTPITDHPSIVAAPPSQLPALPLYPNTVYLCESAVVTVGCNESNDGGLTFHDIGTPFPLPDPCNGIAGRLAASSDGTIFLPKAECGAVQVASTFDDGTTWTVSTVKGFKEIDNGGDPVVAVDGAGTVYLATIDAAGRIVLFTSTDHGASWSAPLDVMPASLTAGDLPAIAAANGRIAIAYYATPSPGGFGNPEADWGGYISVLDGKALAPHAPTARINPPSDPFARGVCGPGRCQRALDFISVQLDQKGRAWAAFVDACPAACAKAADSTDDAGVVGMWNGKP